MPQPQRRDPAPAPSKVKPIRESLQETVNRQTVKIAEDGIRSIDSLKTRALRSLKEKYGITDVDDLAEDFASAAKRLLIRGLSK